MAIQLNPAANQWKVPDYQAVLQLLPLGSTTEYYTGKYGYHGLHQNKSLTTLFIDEDGVMAWSPTLGQLRELAHPLLNFCHARLLADFHCTRDYFPLPGGQNRTALPQTLPSDVDTPTQFNVAAIHVQTALRELIPILNGSPPCSLPQWASLPLPGFILPKPFSYEQPLVPSEDSPPMPRAPIPVTPAAEEDLESDEDINDTVFGAAPYWDGEPIPDCDCSPSFRRRQADAKAATGTETPPPQFSTDFLHSLHGIVLVRSDAPPFVREVNSNGDAVSLQRQSSNLPAANHSATLAATWTIPLMDPIGATACGEVVHSLSASGNLIHSWCVEPSLEPAILPHPCDQTLIVCVTQPLRARRSFARKVLGTWISFPPMPTGTLVQWRLPPPHIHTFYCTRFILGDHELEDSFFQPSVVFADGSSTRDTGAYLAALGLTPADIAKLGMCDLDTLASVYRKVLTHDSVDFHSLVRNLLLGEASASLLPPVYQGLFLGSRFADWARASSPPESASSSSSSSEGALNHGFIEDRPESGASNLTSTSMPSSEPLSEEDVVEGGLMDSPSPPDSGHVSPYAWASLGFLPVLPLESGNRQRVVIDADAFPGILAAPLADQSEEPTPESTQ